MDPPSCACILGRRQASAPNFCAQVNTLSALLSLLCVWDVLRRVSVLEDVCFSPVCLLRHLDEEASRRAHAPPASLNSPMRSNHKPQRPARTGRQESLHDPPWRKIIIVLGKKKRVTHEREEEEKMWRSVLKWRKPQEESAATLQIYSQEEDVTVRVSAAANSSQNNDVRESRRRGNEADSYTWSCWILMLLLFKKNVFF